MAQNGGYYPAQGQPAQPSQPQFQPVYQQPQNIYQQLGKPQPQPHLQGHPNYAQRSPQGQGFQSTQSQFPGQQPSQYQQPYQPSQTPYKTPQTPYAISHTPFMQSTTPFAPPQPQPSPFIQSQPPYQAPQTPYAQGQPGYPQQQPLHIQQQYPSLNQQQAGQAPGAFSYSNPPVSSFPHHTPSVLSNPAGPMPRPVSTFRPPPVAPSASLAQQVRAQSVHPGQPSQVRPPQQQQPIQPPPPPQRPQIQTSTPLSHGPQSAQGSPTKLPSTPSTVGTRRPLPQPSPGVNTKPPTLPPVLQRVPNFAGLASSAPGNSIPSASATVSAATTGRPFPAAQSNSKSEAPPRSTPSPTRNSRPLPTPSAANKRATIDLGKPSSGFTFGNGITPGSSTTNSGLSGLPTPPSLGSPSKSADPSKSSATVSGVSKTSSYAMHASSASVDASVPKRRASPPRFTPNATSQPSSGSSSPTKEATWGKLNSNPTPALTLARNAASTSGSISSIPQTMSTSQSYPSSSTTMANATEGSSKKPPPMWKRTIPEVPAPVWGFAAGMVSEPHPKPKAASTQPAPPAQTSSPTKSSGNKLVKKRKSQSMSPVKSAPQSSAYSQPSPQKSHYGAAYYNQPLSQPTQQGQNAAASAYARGASAYKLGAPPSSAKPLNPSRSETEEEGTDETEEYDEDSEEEDDEEIEDPRYHIPKRRSQPKPPRIGHRKHYSQPLANEDEERRQARSRSDSHGRQAYSHDRYEEDDDEEEDEDEDETPRKATPRAHKLLRLKDRVDPYAGYEDISPIGSSKNLKKIRPKALDTEEEDDGYGNSSRRRILRRDEVEIVRKGDRGSGFSDKGRSAGGASKTIKHQRSSSAIEERERQILKSRQGRQEPVKEKRRPESAFTRRGRYGDEDDDDDTEDEEEYGLAYDDEEEEADDVRRRGKGRPRRFTAREPSYQGNDISRKGDRRRMMNASSGSAHNHFDDERGEDEHVSNPQASSRGRSGLPQPPTMTRNAQTSPSKVSGGPRWQASSVPLKHDSQVQDQIRQFSTMHISGSNGQSNGRSDSRMSGASSNASGNSFTSNAWPQDLPRLPRTPGSAHTPGTGGHVDSPAGGYFDIPLQSHNQQPVSEFDERQHRSRSQGPPSHPTQREPNVYLDDPPPQASVMRTPSPGPSGGYTFQRRPQSQVYDHQAHAPQPPNLPRRPQSQVYGKTHSQPQQATFNHRQPPPQHPISQYQRNIRGVGGHHHHGSSGSQSAFGHSTRHPAQTPAPPPTVGIESPYPVGGREKMADIPKMEEDSEHGSDIEMARRSPGMIPSINVESDVSRQSQSRPPAIQVNSPEPNSNTHPNIPSISIDTPSIRVNEPLQEQNQHADSVPKIQVFEVPGVSVLGPGFGEGQSGPTINVSGPDDQPQSSPARQPPQHTQRPPSTASSYGSGFGQPPRSGGLFCGGCHAAITNGRIVSAMGARWHPSCFKCTVCSTLLEHVSSYEHDGRPYCHLDYHESFAPRCYSCKTAIIDEQFISLDDPGLGKRTYHAQHFFCSECGDPFLDPSAPLSTDENGELALSGDGEFEGFTVYKGYPYCEACHVRLRLPKCKRCRKPIRDHDEAVEALGGKWCWGCFVCAGCENPFESPSFFQREDKPFCEHCFSIILRNEI